jgi:hypothetical protein
MADMSLTAFLPDEWADFAKVLETVVCPGASLYRWEEHSLEDGSRRRSAHLIRTPEGPTVDAIRSSAIERARNAGFRFTRLEDGGATTILVDDSRGAPPSDSAPRSAPLGDRSLRIGTAPLPPRVTLDLTDRVASRGAAEFPAIVDPFRLAAHAGAATLERVHRFAELDLEKRDCFTGATTRARTRGAYDALALCKLLEEASFVEDGDRWFRDDDRTTTEVRLRDGAVEIAVLPR